MMRMTKISSGPMLPLCTEVPRKEGFSEVRLKIRCLRDTLRFLMSYHANLC